MLDILEPIAVCKCGIGHVFVRPGFRLANYGEPSDGVYFECQCGSTVFMDRKLFAEKLPETYEVLKKAGKL